MLLLTLRGTPTCYYGDELGMQNVTIPPDRMQDPGALNQPEVAHLFGRDPVRTPMQWDASPNAGFCPADTQPWLPLSSNADQENVATQLVDESSMLNLYRRLLAFRKAEPALVRGDYRSLIIQPEQAANRCFVYERSYQGQTLIVALNFSDQPVRFELVGHQRGEVVLSTVRPTGERLDLTDFKLDANAGCILRSKEGSSHA